MNYKQTIDKLYGMLPDYQRIGAGAYKPGLDRVLSFNAYLGDPVSRVRTIHVAGTNGKGSVSHMLASVLYTAGYKVGLYTSPHLKDFRERIRVDGEQIPEKAVMDFTNRHLSFMENSRLSFFEATFGMAMDWFDSNGVDIAIIETGLGGRLDATNIIEPQLSVITNIGLDHQEFLGDTLPLIAAEKGGIIKPGVPVVIGERNPVTDGVFTGIAARSHSPIMFAEDLFMITGTNGHGEYIVADRRSGGNVSYGTDLAGLYQKKNLVTVLGAMSVLRNKLPEITERDIREGMMSVKENTGLRGRWEVLGHDPLIVCDTGHNAHGMEYVVRQIREQTYKKLYMVIGMVSDKDAPSVLKIMPVDAHYIFTQPGIDRAMPARTLADYGAGAGLNGEVVTDLREAYAKARSMARPEDMIFIGGSTFVAAEIL